MELTSMNQTDQCTIKVSFSAAQEPVERIDVSSGTMPPAWLESSTQPYEEWARIPRAPWRKPSEEEINRLTAKEADSERSNVQLVRAPKTLMSRFQTALGDTASYPTAGDLQARFNTEEFRSCMEGLGDWAGQFGEETKERERLIRVNCPGLHTVSRDPARGTYIGMHVDNSYCYA